MDAVAGTEDVLDDDEVPLVVVDLEAVQAEYAHEERLGVGAQVVRVGGQHAAHLVRLGARDSLDHVLSVLGPVEEGARLALRHLLREAEEIAQQQAPDHLSDAHREQEVVVADAAGAPHGAELLGAVACDLAAAPVRRGDGEDILDAAARLQVLPKSL